MKVTWFGGTTLRIHIGGEMLIADAGSVPAGLDRDEITSGVDREFSISDANLSTADAATWKPPAIARAIEETSARPVQVVRIAEHAVLLAAPGEPPLVIVTSHPIPEAGRWAAEAVVVILGALEVASAALDAFHPRLIAIAGTEGAIESTVAELRDDLDGTGLVALEPGLALEV